jgi:hypothetical protein
MRHFIKVSPKLVDGALLLLSQIVELSFEFLQIRNIPKQIVGIQKVFVDVIEVGQQNFAPKEKLVERLNMTGFFRVNLVKLDNQRNRIGLLQVG